MRTSGSADRSFAQSPALLRSGVLVIGSTGAAAARWFQTGPGARWPETGLESPGVRGCGFADVIHRPDMLDQVRTSRAVLIIVRRDDEAREAMRAIWRCQEAGARGVIVVEDGAGLPRHRLASGGGLALLPGGADAGLLAGLLAGLMHEGQRLRELDQQLTAAKLAHHYAGEALNRLDDELHLAARLQQEIMPRDLPELPGLQAAALFQPLWHVSGDIYRVSRLDEHRVGVLLADAMGHGVAAAMYTMLIACGLVTKDVSGRSYRIVPPAEALTRLNTELLRQQHDPQAGAVRFASAVYLVVDTSTRRVRGAVAGHAGPLVIGPEAGRTGEFVEHQGSGPVVGVFADATFDEFEFELPVAHTLAIYSDGVEQAFLDEAMVQGRIRAGHRPAHRELLARLLGATGSLTEDLAGLREHLASRPGSLHRSDDLTVVAIRAA